MSLQVGSDSPTTFPYPNQLPVGPAEGPDLSADGLAPVCLSLPLLLAEGEVTMHPLSLSASQPVTASSCLDCISKPMKRTVRPEGRL